MKTKSQQPKSLKTMNRSNPNTCDIDVLQERVLDRLTELGIACVTISYDGEDAEISDDDDAVDIDDEPVGLEELERRTRVDIEIFMRRMLNPICSHSTEGGCFVIDVASRKVSAEQGEYTDEVVYTTYEL